MGAAGCAATVACLIIGDCYVVTLFSNFVCVIKTSNMTGKNLLHITDSDINANLFSLLMLFSRAR
jgi:hypothetical protein